MGLVQVSQVGDWLGWDNARVTAEHDRLSRIVETASETVERRCGRSFTSATGQRSFTVHRRTREVLVGDIQSATAVEHRYFPQGDYVPLAAADYTLGGGLVGRPSRMIIRLDGQFNPGPDAVRVTGVWGWASVPPSVQQAVIMETARLMMRVKSPGGGLSGFDGSDMLPGGIVRDVDIMELLDNYTIPVMA